MTCCLPLQPNGFPDHSRRGPAHRKPHGCIERQPASVVENLEIDVRKEMRTKRIGASDHEAHRMPDCLQHGAEQDGHVVAVAGAQIEHSPCGVKHLNSQWILRIPDALLNELEKRIDFTEIVLRPYTAFD